ncbi:MAG: shikimate dehydrogenase [Candidatus Gracilibacteria bacterium]
MDRHSANEDLSNVGKRRFGILAYPAGHSLSPAMFNAAFKTLGMEGVSYEVFEVAPEDLERFMRAREFDGLSVSLPYKEIVMEFLDEVDEDAKKIGAVNTVSVRDISKGQAMSGTCLHGFNTDWIGAVAALKEECEVLSGKKVVVLGAGGAARAIVYGLLREEAKVVVLNRDLDEAKSLGGDFGENFGAEIEVGLLSDVATNASKYECDILVQATSVWITEGLNVKIVPDSYVQELGARGCVVMDIVYKPLITPLLEVAQKAGCRVVTGEKMLLNQAVKQFEIWFGEQAGGLGLVREAMKKVLSSNITVD